MLNTAAKQFGSMTHPLSSKTIRLFSTSSPSAASCEKVFALCYTYVNNMAEKRGAHRTGHLELATEGVKRNEIIAAGAFVPDLDGGLFLFKGENAEQNAKDFVAKDPYNLAGLITKWEVKEWAVAVGQANIGISKL